MENPPNHRCLLRQLEKIEPFLVGLTYISSIRWDTSSRWDWDLVFVGGGGYFRWGLTFSGGGSDPLPNYDSNFSISWVYIVVDKGLILPQNGMSVQFSVLELRSSKMGQNGLKLESFYFCWKSLTMALLVFV